MKIPRSLTIGGRKWRVVFSDLSSEGAFGTTDLNERIITLHEGLSSSKAQETFLHELLHAIIGYPGEALLGDKEEALVRIMTPGLMDALKAVTK